MTNSPDPRVFVQELKRSRRPPLDRTSLLALALFVAALAAVALMVMNAHG